MKLSNLTSVIAALALATPALAQTPSKEPGASQYSPGHEMQKKGSRPGEPGASGYTPGHEMQKKDDKGASRYTPSNQAKEKNSKDSSSMGSSSGTGSKY